MANAWQPVKVIIDATGVGAGLASFLADKLGTKVLPFEFSTISKVRPWLVVYLDHRERSL